MVGQLRHELQQTKPFESLSVEAFLNILRTASVLQHQMHQPLKVHGLSPEQYNVLRILRGAGQGGCSCGQIADRMITRDPDITRLLDRLGAQGLIARERDARDRRVVVARITREGLALIKRLNQPVKSAHDRLLGHLSDKQAAQLINLLEIARQRAG